MQSKLVYKFGPYILDPFNRVLVRSGSVVVGLTAQTFEVLLVLVRHSDDFVSREEFRREAWKGTVVEKGALRFHIHVLRNQILKGSAEETIEIQTDRQRGYRLAIKAQSISTGEITEADRNYLEGKYHWQKATAHSVRDAIGFFERAVALDPRHALAYSAVADSVVAGGQLWPSKRFTVDRHA